MGLCLASNCILARNEPIWNVWNTCRLWTSKLISQRAKKTTCFLNFWLNPNKMFDLLKMFKMWLSKQEKCQLSECFICTKGRTPTCSPDLKLWITLTCARGADSTPKLRSKQENNAACLKLFSNCFYLKLANTKAHIDGEQFTHCIINVADKQTPRWADRTKNDGHQQFFRKK